MERSIFDQSPLTCRHFVDWLIKADPGLVFDARRPKGCLLALFFQAQIGERFFTAQQTYGVIDSVDHPYGATWAAQVSEFELQVANGFRDVRHVGPSAIDSVLLSVGGIRDRLLVLLSEFG